MAQVISFKDYRFVNVYAKGLAEYYFDYISIVWSHELTDYERRNHTNIIDIKHLGEHEKDIVVSEREAYYYMHSKYPKTYPLDLNKSIQLLPHFQDLKKMAKLTSEEKKEIIKKEKYKLLKKIYPKKEFLEALAEMKKVLWEGTEHWNALLLERAEASGRLALSQNTKKALEKFKK